MRINIDILLSTYNGERFIAKQIESLFSQNYQEWRLIVRDDGSSDATLEILDKYAHNYPDKIVLLEDVGGNVGIVRSYDLLLRSSSAPYVAFCDQDDYWDADKLLLESRKMHELESVYGNTVPMLIHTDLIVVDQDMCVISSSFWQYQHLSPDKMTTLPRLLVQNCITGCTVMINRPLVDLALPLPDGIIMHDWWLALIAVSEGVVCALKEATVKYRQHGQNDTGAKHWGLGSVVRALKHGRKPLLANLYRTSVQARLLLESGVLKPESSRIVKRYVDLYASNWITRRIEMLRMRFFKYGIIRNFGMFFRI